MPTFPSIAIIDFGMGNLLNVQRACSVVGLHGVVTSTPADIVDASGIILPGVGAFGRAMQRLHELQLVSVLRDEAQRGKPFMGVCLGMQLLMSSSEEFGDHAGLDLIPGRVVRLPASHGKVPLVGWNRVLPVDGGWDDSLLSGVGPGTYMYFVHSYHAKPLNESYCLARSPFGDGDFCAAVRCGSISGFQFHPERSGPDGLHVYGNFAKAVRNQYSEACECP